MRPSITATFFVFACAVFACALLAMGTAGAATVTIDGAPLNDAFGGSRPDRMGVVTLLGHRVVRAIAGSSAGYRDAQVTMLPDISAAQLTQAPDGSSATVAQSDKVGESAIGSDAASNDPGGKVLLVWLWLLPISGSLSLAAYVVVIGQLNRSFAASAARSGKPNKPLGLFV